MPNMQDTMTQMMQKLSLTSTKTSKKPSENSGTTSPSTNPSPEDYTETQKDVLREWVKTEYSKCKSQRSNAQKQWEYNLLMYGGKQWAQMIVGKIATPQLPSHRVRSVTNLLRPMVRMEMTRMNNQKPSASVVPVSGSDDDMFAAQAGEAVWESLYSRKRIHQLQIRNSFWVATTGNGFFKTFWDQNIVDRTFLTVDPMLQKPIPSVGDVAFGVVTPFNFFVPDLLIEEVEDQPYVIEAYTKSATWVNTFWKDFLPEAVRPSIVGRFEVFESAYFGANGNDGSAVPDSVLVLEAYLKPGAHPLCPQGAMITIVGDHVVQISKGMPYSHGEYPVSHTKHIWTGKFYGESILTDTIPLQKEYNRTRSQMIETKIRSSRPAVMYREGSLDPRRVTSQPGQMIPVKPGYDMPVPLQPQDLPGFVKDEPSLIKSDMEDLSGQHAVSRGHGPGGGIVAATAINYLQEQDDSLMYITYASIEAAFEKTARHALTIVADFWDLPKIIRTVGTDGAFDSQELKGSDISNGIDIRVEAGSSLPTSKAARQAFLMDLLKFGAITPEQMLDLIDIGGVKKLTELIRIDMKAAQRENIKLKKLDPMQIMQADMEHQQGMQPDAMGNINPDTIDEGSGLTVQRPLLVPVNEWDNHKVHIEVHDRFRKSQEFELLSEEIKKEFADHIMAHRVQIMVAEGQMMAQQAGMMGQDPQAGGGEFPGMEPGQNEPPPEDPMAAGAGQEMMAPEGVMA